LGSSHGTSEYFSTLLSRTLILADQPDELELVIFDVKPTHVGAVRVAIVVEAETTSDSLEVLRVTQGFQDLGSIPSSSAFDRIDGDDARLVGIHRPADWFLLVLRLIICVEALAYFGVELIGRQPRKRHIHIVIHSRRGGLLQQCGGV